MLSGLATRAACLLIGYAFGNFLTAEAVARRALGQSAFDVGTHNPGMANIGSLLGWKSAAAVLAGDIGKTIAAVWASFAVCAVLPAGGELTADVFAPLGGAGADASAFGAALMGAGFPWSGTLCALYAGLGCTLGHDFPCWHRFRGGKGVAASCAAIVLFSPVIGGVACVLGFIVVVASHQLCYGAVAIPLAFEAGLLIFHGGIESACLGAAILVLACAKHGGPCIRALQGREPETRLFKT